MKYFAFIFDFDFTLADASNGIVESFNYALGKQGIKPKEHDEICKTVGMTLKEAFFVLTGIDDIEAAQYFIERFHEKADLVMTPNTVLFPDTITILKELNARGIKTGIVTNKLRNRIVDVLEKFNVADLVGCIIGFGDVKQAKPSPEGLFKAIHLLDVPKSSVIYIGDSLIDAQTAKFADVDFAAVTTGTTDAFEFESFPHISISSSLSELFNNIN